MPEKYNTPGDIGLERLCKGLPADYIHRKNLARGIELLEVWFNGYAYDRHRHDTYAVCLTTAGVQRFSYRGASRVSTPGNVVVLHPDEPHDGRAGTHEGLGYQILYIDPGLIFEAVRWFGGSGASLPFVNPPVLKNKTLSASVLRAVSGTKEPLAMDCLISDLAEGLMSAAASSPASKPRFVDFAALDRARRFLDAEKKRAVRSWELEKVTGLSRFELSRQFRYRYGTSPYRYLLMRRLDFARMQLAGSRPLADIALDAGFSDQAHFTRMFKAGFGLTPARYRDVVMR